MFTKASKIPSSCLIEEGNQHIGFFLNEEIVNYRIFGALNFFAGPFGPEKISPQGRHSFPKEPEDQV